MFDESALLSNLDQREQLYNSGEIGPIGEVQVSSERIVSLRGILFDLDPPHFRASTLIERVPQDPGEFFRSIVHRWISHHPLLTRCEVRNSGTGVHLILWFEQPVAIATDEERRRWAGIVKTVQAALPIDPDQPDITAVTRSLDSHNSKNSAPVSLLQTGEPVPQEDVLELFTQMKEAPFITVMNILAGASKLEPCPVCGKEGSRLNGLNRVGQCYGSCGKVKLDQLYDVVLAPRDNSSGKEATADVSDE